MPVVLTFTDRCIGPVHLIVGSVDGASLVIGYSVIDVVAFHTLDLTVCGEPRVTGIGCYVAVGRLGQRGAVLDVALRGDARPRVVPKAVSHSEADKGEAIVAAKGAVGIRDLAPRAGDGSVLGCFQYLLTTLSYMYAEIQ